MLNLLEKTNFFYTDKSTGTTEAREFTADATNPIATRTATYNEGFAKRKILTDAAAVNKISIL